MHHKTHDMTWSKYFLKNENDYPHQNVFLKALVEAPNRLEAMYKALSGPTWKIRKIRDDFDTSFDDLFRVCMDLNKSEDNRNILRDVIMVVGKLYEVSEDDLLKVSDVIMNYAWTSFIPEHDKIILDISENIKCNKKVTHMQIRNCKNINNQVDRKIVKFLHENFCNYPDLRMDRDIEFINVIKWISRTQIEHPMHPGVTKMQLERVFQDKDLVDKFISLGNKSRTLDLYDICYYFNESTAFMAPYLRFINMKYDPENLFFINGYKAMQNCIDNNDLETFKILIEMGMGINNTDLDRNNLYGYAIFKNLKFAEIIMKYANKPFHKYIDMVINSISDQNYQIDVDAIAENIKPFEYIHGLNNPHLYNLYTHKYDVPMHLMIRGRFNDTQKLYNRLAKHFPYFNITLDIDALQTSYDKFMKTKSDEDLNLFVNVCKSCVKNSIQCFDSALTDLYLVTKENGFAAVKEMLKFLKNKKYSEFITCYNTLVNAYKSKVQSISDIYATYPGVITDPNKISDKIEYFNVLHDFHVNYIPNMDAILIDNYKRMLMLIRK